METSAKKITGIIIAQFLVTLFTFSIFTLALRPGIGSYLMGAAVIFAFVWVAIIAYGLGLVESRFNALMVFLGLPAILAIIGLGQPSAFSAAILLGILLFAAHTKAQDEITSRQEYNPWRVFSTPAQLLLIGLVISYAGLALPVLADDLATANFAIPPDAVAAVLRPVSGLINAWIPGYTSHAAINDLIFNWIRQFEPGRTPSNQEIELARLELSQHFQVPIQEDDTLPAVMSRYIDRRLTEITNAYPVISALGFLVSIILLTRLFIPLFAVFSRLLILMLDYLARKSGLIVVEKKSQLVDIITV